MRFEFRTDIYGLSFMVFASGKQVLYHFLKAGVVVVPYTVQVTTLAGMKFLGVLELTRFWEVSDNRCCHGNTFKNFGSLRLLAFDIA